MGARQALSIGAAKIGSSADAARFSRDCRRMPKIKAHLAIIAAISSNANVGPKRKTLCPLGVLPKLQRSGLAVAAALELH
jgi:hypothetical protein